MTGFRIALKNIRFKEDPTGRVRIYRAAHKLDASKRKRIHAQAKREAAKWQAAEHYTPIPKEGSE